MNSDKFLRRNKNLFAPSKAETFVSFAVVGLWLLYVAVCVSGVGLIGWAAYHFIHKYW